MKRLKFPPRLGGCARTTTLRCALRSAKSDSIRASPRRAVLRKVRGDEVGRYAAGAYRGRAPAACRSGGEGLASIAIMYFIVIGWTSRRSTLEAMSRLRRRTQSSTRTSRGVPAPSGVSAMRVEELPSAPVPAAVPSQQRIRPALDSSFNEELALPWSVRSAGESRDINTCRCVEQYEASISRRSLRPRDCRDAHRSARRPR